MSKAKWLGSKRCDFCHDELEGLKFFVDGKTKSGGRWGVMCPECYDRWGYGIGVGLGQMYDGTTFEQIAGGSAS